MREVLISWSGVRLAEPRSVGGRGPAPGVELRVAIQVVRCRLGDEFREPAESELSVGVTSPPVSGVRGLPLTPDDFLR